MTANVSRMPRPRGELDPARATRLRALVDAQAETDAAIKSESLAALLEDGASFRVVSELTGLSTNTLQRWKREAQ